MNYAKAFHTARAKYLIAQAAKESEQKIEQMLNSGAIDIDKFTEEDFRLANIITTAALRSTCNMFQPLTEEDFAEVENLEKKYKG